MFNLLDTWIIALLLGFVYNMVIHLWTSFLIGIQVWGQYLVFNLRTYVF